MNKVKTKVDKIQSELVEIGKCIEFYEEHGLDPLPLLKKHQKLIDERQSLLKDSEITYEQIKNLRNTNTKLVELIKIVINQIDLDIEVSELLRSSGLCLNQEISN